MPKCVRQNGQKYLSWRNTVGKKSKIRDFFLISGINILSRCHDVLIDDVAAVTWRPLSSTKLHSYFVPGVV